MEMSEVVDTIRRICARLADESLGSDKAVQYQIQLKQATEELRREQDAWGGPHEGDVHQDVARQPYSSREQDSSDAFAEGLNL